MALIQEVKIRNYKSFIEQTLFFETGFNIISGRNNTGKTSLLEALSLEFECIPHKLTFNSVSPYSRENSSVVEVKFKTTIDDLRKYLNQNRFITLPFSQGQEPFHIKADPDAGAPGKFVAHELNKIFEGIQDFSSVLLKEVTPENNNLNGSVSVNYKRALQLFGYPYPNKIQVFGDFMLSNKNAFQIQFNGKATADKFQVSEENVFDHISSNIYYIRANRNVHDYALISDNAVLKTDASNLASVLHYQCINNHDIFQEVLNKFQLIFPEVKSIGFDIISKNNVPFVELQLWYEEANSRLRDRAVPLHKCGTGASHVLAILGGVFIASTPKTFIIDEPQSFLHPGAIRSLFQILKDHNRSLAQPHQYIVATHSPFLVTASDNQSLMLIHRNNWQSQVEIIKPNDNEEIKLFLLEIGVRLSDVFGVDNVMWVEGITEEYCFKSILSKLSRTPMLGTKILSLYATGDLEQKSRINTERILHIYEKLTHSGSLMPPTISFILDREGRKESEIEEIRKRSNNLIKFIDVRLYENYILDPSAIYYVLNNIALDSNSEIDISLHKVETLLEEKLRNNLYYENKIVPETLSEKLKAVHGANLIKDIFSEISNNTIEFKKNPNSGEITDYIINNNGEKLKDLKLFLESVLSLRD